MSDLKTLNDTGDIVKISYNSSLKDECLEIVKTLNCGDCDDIVIKNVVMDFSGHIITCKYEDATWIRDNQMEYSALPGVLSSSFNVGLYNEGRLEKLLKREEHRKRHTDMTDVCRDLLQRLLMTKPSLPLQAIIQYFN